MNHSKQILYDYKRKTERNHNLNKRKIQKEKRRKKELPRGRVI